MALIRAVAEHSLRLLKEETVEKSNFLVHLNLTEGHPTPAHKAGGVVVLEVVEEK